MTRMHFLRRVAIVTVTLGVVAAGLVEVADPVTAGAATNGSWSVTSTPADVRAVHVTLLRTGKVLLVAGSGNNQGNFDAGSFETSIWDPATGNLKAVATPWDAFCSGHVMLPDGRILIAGGTSAYQSPATNNNHAGSKKSYIFDPATEQYQAVSNMHLARWYPTLTELGDGRVLALGGLDEHGDYTSQFETFKGTRWSTPAPGPSNYVWQPMYPALHQMRDGRLFYSGVNTFGGNAAEVPPGMWDVNTGAYTNVPGLTNDTLRDQGASVMLPPAQSQRVMVMGGGDHSHDVGAVASTAIADLKAPSPAFVPGPSMDAAKMYVSAVVLPDSTVLQTGGGAKSVVFSGAPVLSTQIYNP
ncbi:MAG: galactose oxidase, partial [Acidimicrobiia bacterium]